MSKARRTPLAEAVAAEGRDALRLDAQICFAVYGANNAIGRAYQPLLAKLDLTYLQYVTMLALREEDGVRVKDLGARLRLDSGTLTPLLKRLERKELVERRRDAEDERVVRIHLTRPGRALRRRAAKVPEALACRVGLSVEEAQELARLCARVLEELG